MKKNFYFTAIFVAAFSFYNDENQAWAKSSQYPYVSGQTLFEFKSDQKIDSKTKGVPRNNTYINIEPDFSLNLNKEWSIKTGWRILPIMQDRNGPHPERSRTILTADRGLNQDDTAFIVEELKAFYQNDDMKFFAGKFNPTFATMYRKSKRVGVFLTDFTEDYELREKIGFGAAALLEDSEITFNTFFNDITGLSGSGLRRRPREHRNGNLSGNTATLSSYTITVEGQSIMGLRDLYYNIGYRSLDVNNDSQDNFTTARETGYTANLEYLFKLKNNVSLIPLIEYVKINNFTGLRDRDAKYITTSIIAKYESWSASISNLNRNIDHNYDGSKMRDRQLQFNIGYKFNNNMVLDVSRVNLKEDGHKATLMGVMLSYVYKF